MGMAVTMSSNISNLLKPCGHVGGERTGAKEPQQDLISLSPTGC